MFMSYHYALFKNKDKSLKSIVILMSLLASLFGDVLLREEFDTLNQWEDLHFEKIKEHSVYETKDSTLVAKSDASASGVTFKKKYDIYKYPVIKFKWKVDNVFAKGNAKVKSGDDYPIRIYVNFAYNPDKASFTEGILYSVAKKFYGEYPPHSAMNYIWANKKGLKGAVNNAYTSKVKMIALDEGVEKVGQWVEHTVNVLEDYKKAFGEKPPKMVSLAIMNDSDNTQEKATSYMDFIEISSE